MTTKDKLEDLGLTEAQVAAVEAIIEEAAEAAALPYAGELLHRIMIRVDRDSMHGRALARALGMTSDVSLERAAAAFGVSKQALHQLQAKVEPKLRGIAEPAAKAQNGESYPIPKKKGPSR